ncbi:25464_t:CDS:2, partial [Racocetra persica]
INNYYEFPMEIDLEKYLSSEAEKIKQHKYLLYGVLVHSGYCYGGRYFALIKPNKNGKWLKFDDDRVLPVTDKEVLENNYGDGLSSAYVLVYIRESDIDNVLSPMPPEDIPKNLQSHLDGQKKKESDEKKSWLYVKIATPKTLNLHQDYGVANFNDPLSKVPQFKVLKTETYRNFKARHVTKLEISTEQIRFWVFRQHDITPISENWIDFSMDRVYNGFGLRQNEMNLYLEIAHKPINGEAWFPPAVRNPYVMIFVKYFDPNTQYL